MISEKTVQAFDKTPEKAAASQVKRLHFVDHLRTMLAILVVLHHISLVYGASLPGYYYIEPPFTEPMTFQWLLIFALVNQGWFMGAFFLFAGYFTPGAIDRKGAGTFLKNRLLRLGIPIILFYFILSPLSFMGYYLMPAELTGITTSPSWKAYPELIGLGPLWFVAMLLIFSIGYAVIRIITGNQARENEDTTPGYLGVLLFTLALALVSYLTRQVIPLGKSVYQFPTLAYLPQYLSFFMIGLVAYRKNWFRTISARMGAAGILVALVASVFLFPLAFTGEWFTLALGPGLENAFGNGHWQSAVYALWDSAFAVGLSIGLIALSRSLFNRQSEFGNFLAKHSYTVYIIHIPIVVFMAYWLRGLTLPGLQKFGIVSLIIVPVCFAAAYLVRKLPFASKVF